MNITVFTKVSTQDIYPLSLDAESKSKTYEVISSKYADDTIEKIEITYDSLHVTTLDGHNITETGGTKAVGTLYELKVELGRYTG